MLSLTTKTLTVRKISAIPSMLAVLLLSLACSSGEIETNLRFKYHTGMSLRYKQSTRGTIQVFAKDSLIRDWSNDIQTSLTLHVDSLVSDSIAIVKQEKTVTLRSFNNLDSTQTNTTENEPDLLYLMRPNGSIESVRYADTSMITGSWLKSLYDQSMPVFPEGIFKKGQTWTQEYEVRAGDSLTSSSTTFIIRSFAQENGYDCAIIEFEGDLILPIELSVDDPTQRQGNDFISSKGIMYFAYKEGFVVLQNEKWIQRGDRSKIIEESDEPVSYRIEAKYTNNFELVDSSM